MGDIVLCTQKLTKKYGKFLALDNVDMEIKQGDIYGLVGKNGAGKTTLMKIIAGLSIKTSGEFELFSENSESGLAKSRLRTGCITEIPSFFSYLSARKNLEYYRIQRGIIGKECVDEALKFVGLLDTGSKKFKNFSLGMKQRLGLALVIMGSPDFLILDEPINGLDPMGIAEFREILKMLNQKKNTTILISSHILSELSQIATTYGFINDGKLIKEISAEKLAEKCKQHILVKVDDSSKASIILEKEFKCNDYEVLNSNEIRIFKHLATPELINKAFVTNGIMVSSIYQVGINLENYFIDLIGGKHNV